MTHAEILSDLYKTTFGFAPAEVNPMAGAGSNRCYYLLTSPVAGGDVPLKVVGTVGTDEEENRAFMALAEHFAAKGLPVPKVYAAKADDSAYLQQWVGDRSLFDAIEHGRLTGDFSGEEKALVRRTMEMLPRVQYEGAEGLDFEVCYPEEAMRGATVDADMAYFKYCFLKVTGIEFSEREADAELQRLGSLLKSEIERAGECFMIRDFQSRNVMLLDGEPYLIDFQGGRRGPAQYDVASFLWQAKARFTPELRREMTEVYCSKAREVCAAFDAVHFRRSLPAFVLFRILQTLGAYGFRGLTERKPHFLQSLPYGVAGLHDFFSHPQDSDFAATATQFPYLARLSEMLMEAPVTEDLRAVAAVPPYAGLTVTVSSFSYKRGVPFDLSGNGGGFVFDCRAVHNPGRYDQYKPLTGMDRPVIEFLEENGEIFPFLDNCKALVVPAVERYLKRGFTSLSVAFGCTGGRHRSVYSAEALGRYIASEYPQVRVVVNHREQRKLYILNQKQKETGK